MTVSLSQYAADWHFEDPQLIASTHTADLYKARQGEQFVVLKLLKALGAADEKNGAAALAHFAGQGAVRLLQHDDRALLLEYAEGPDLKSLVTDGKDTEATEIIAETLNKLHRQPSPAGTHTFTPLKTRFRSLFKKAHGSGGDSFYTQAAKIAQELLDDPKNICVLHGDIHHENIIRSDRGWLAIDPKGIYGERTFDAANTLCNPVGLPDLVLNENRLLQTAGILARGLDIDIQRLLKFTYAYTALSAAWSLEDRQSPDLARKVGALVAPHVL